MTANENMLPRQPQADGVPVIQGVKRVHRMLGIAAAVLFSALPLTAQQVRFSPDLVDSTDTDVKALVELWRRYVASYNHDKTSGNTAPMSFWLDGCDDMLAYSTGGQYPIYCFGEQNVVGIRKVAAGLYELAVEYNMPYWDWEHWTLCHFYRVYAEKRGDDFKLLNYFDVRKRSMESLSTSHVDFYSDRGKISKRGIAPVIKTFDGICATFSLEPKRRITYIVAESIDKCWECLGVSYTVYRSESPYAGFTVFPSTVLATVPDKLHELVHALFLPYYPFAPSLLHEGLATYYGGSVGNDFVILANKLDDWILRNEIDLSDENALNAHFCENVPLLYAIGAVLISHTLRNFGAGKVLQLLEKSSNDEVFEMLGIPVSGATEWLHDAIRQR